MAASSTRQRLIQSALELFMAQGVSGTTTRQIAEGADVNEVTLFRQFGNKHGLLLAVLAESAALKTLGRG
jgi:AcrR family transcriptional regulator